MTDYGTIKLPRNEYEQHNERRKDMGLTWSEYVNGEAPEIRNDSASADNVEKIAREITGNLARGDLSVDEDTIADAVLEQMGTVDYDDVKSACKVAIREELPVERMGGR